MRILLTVPLLLLGACDVGVDDANDSVSVQYNQDTAENVASDAGNLAQNVGGAIANDVEKTADKVQNTNVDVDVNAREEPAENAQ